MNCPHCETKTRVRETMLLDGDVVRRRVCQTCGHSFGTREQFDEKSMIGSGTGNNPKSHQHIDKARQAFADLYRAWGSRK